MAEINKAIFMWLHGSLRTFHSTDTVEQSGDKDDGNVVPPPLKLLQAFNPSSLPLLKLSLKVDTPVILLQNLYPKEGLYNGTYIIIICIGRCCIETQILGGSFYG